jgi:hypothetical protein
MGVRVDENRGAASGLCIRCGRCASSCRSVLRRACRSGADVRVDRQRCARRFSRFECKSEEKENNRATPFGRHSHTRVVENQNHVLGRRCRGSCRACPPCQLCRVAFLTAPLSRDLRHGVVVRVFWLNRDGFWLGLIQK